MIVKGQARKRPPAREGSPERLRDEAVTQTLQVPLRFSTYLDGTFSVRHTLSNLAATWGY